MGQYYRPAMLIDGEVRIFNRDIDGEYTFAKLTEHSWIANDLLNAIGELMYQKKVRLVWCGDYAEDELCSEFSSANKILTPKDIWDVEGQGLESTNFTIDGLYLCNHDRLEFIDIDEYIKKSGGKDRDGDFWCLNPISLLTAKGNGQGGGDYWGENEELVGSWCWDLISLEQEAPEGYKEDKEIIFKERNSFYA